MAQIRRGRSELLAPGSVRSARAHLGWSHRKAKPNKGRSQLPQVEATDVQPTTAQLLKVRSPRGQKMHASFETVCRRSSSAANRQSLSPDVHAPAHFASISGLKGPCALSRCHTTRIRRVIVHSIRIEALYGYDNSSNCSAYELARHRHVKIRVERCQPRTMVRRHFVSAFFDHRTWRAVNSASWGYVL